MNKGPAERAAEKLSELGLFMNGHQRKLATDIITAEYASIEQDLAKYKERLCIAPCGSDAIDALNSALEQVMEKKASIEQENQKLREALSVIEEASRGTMLTQIHKVAQQALATDKRG